MENMIVKDQKDDKILRKEYATFLKDLKIKVKSAQLKAAVKINTELVTLYWEIGRSIDEKQEQLGWGAKTIETLSKDLKREFPAMKGFSSRNLKYMLKFARAYPKYEIVHQAGALIPWKHNIVLLERVKDENARTWYINKIIEGGWSRSVLEVWIDNDLYGREGKGINNFDQTMAPYDSDLAKELSKDPHNFEFLTLRNEFNEKELEEGLFKHLQSFLLEMGDGFAFVGRQKHLSVGGQDFYIDMLFYHLKARCYVVVELKATAFKPEYVGKLNFYLSAVDDLLRHPNDNPTIGLLICKDKNKVVAEYAVKNVASPINISDFKAKIEEALPTELKRSLPSIEAIEKELEGD